MVPHSLPPTRPGLEKAGLYPSYLRWNREKGLEVVQQASKKPKGRSVTTAPKTSNDPNYKALVTNARDGGNMLPKPKPLELTEKELKERYGMHLTTQLPDGLSNRWADLDDDDDWVPEIVEWSDGVKFSPSTDRARIPYRPVEADRFVLPQENQRGPGHSQWMSSEESKNALKKEQQYRFPRPRRNALSSSDYDSDCRATVGSSRPATYSLFGDDSGNEIGSSNSTVEYDPIVSEIHRTSNDASSIPTQAQMESHDAQPWLHVIPQSYEPPTAQRDAIVEPRPPKLTIPRTSSQAKAAAASVYASKAKQKRTPVPDEPSVVFAMPHTNIPSSMSHVAPNIGNGTPVLNDLTASRVEDKSTNSQVIGIGAPPISPTASSAHQTSLSLFVRQLDPSVTESMLFELFSSIGHVASVRVCLDAVSRRSLGYAYVNYTNSEDCQKALKELNRTIIKGKPCLIMRSQPDPAFQKTDQGAPDAIPPRNSNDFGKPRTVVGWKALLNDPDLDESFQINKGLLGTQNESAREPPNIFEHNKGGFVIPGLRRKAIVIKSPDGEVINFARENFTSPTAPATPKPPAVATAPASPPRNLSANGSTHSRTESVDNKTAAEPKAEFVKDLHAQTQAEATAGENEDSGRSLQEKWLDSDKKPVPVAGENNALSFSPLSNPDHTSHTIFAESSRGTDLNTLRSSSFRGTESTAPTTFSGGPSGVLDKSQMVQNRIEEEPENHGNALSESIVGDGQSTISADSVITLTPQQRTDVVNKFSRALIRDLPSKCFASPDKTVEENNFRQQFTSLIKRYSKQVMEGSARRSRQRQASKAIRILRNEILNKCYEALGGFDRPERNYPDIILQVQEQNLPEKSIVEKVSDWTFEPSATIENAMSYQYSDILNPLQEEFPSIPTEVLAMNTIVMNTVANPPSDNGDSSVIEEDDWSESDSQNEDDTNDINIEDKPVYTYLTEHPAFSELVDELRTIVERQFCDQKDLIHSRILLAVRRPGMAHTLPGSLLQAEFFTDWDILEFLNSQYPLQTSRNLRHIIAITGGPKDAQLTTVEQYLWQNWSTHTWELIDALNAAIEYMDSDLLSGRIVMPKCNIRVCLSEMKISVIGSEDFIVAVGQQFAWLGAACRTSIGSLAHCYTALTEKTSTAPDGLPVPTFHIRYDVEPLLPQELTSCWNNLVGDSVVVANFPIPERNANAVGLQITLDIMAALADVPLATCFRGGYVLKGRSFLIVPVKREDNFIQWHLWNKPKGRISYQEATSLFPDRLSVNELDEEALVTTTCFLGWCSDSICRLASNDYNYTSVNYTKTPYLSKRVLSLTGASVGFQQFGAGSLQFALSKKDGMYHADRAQFYVDLLDDAKQIPVILQDMEDRRAWYTDGETAILHIILHRHALKPFGVHQKVQLKFADLNDAESVRQATLANAEILVACDSNMVAPGLQFVSFKNLVGTLYSMLEGFQAQTEDIVQSGIEMKMNRKKHVQGWEYMDLVNKKLNPRLREAELKSTCGNWPELARDRNAVILFGNRLQNIIGPHPSVRLCKQFKELPKLKDYLAIQSTTLEQMYLESGSVDDRAQITLTGLQLDRSEHLFESCPRSTIKSNNCKCNRIQQLVPKSAKRKIKPVPKSNNLGAFIIGQGTGSWINDWRPFRKAAQLQDSETQTSSTAPPQQPIAPMPPPVAFPSSYGSSSDMLSRLSSNTLSLSTITNPTTVISDTASERSQESEYMSTSPSPRKRINKGKAPAHEDYDISGATRETLAQSNQVTQYHQKQRNSRRPLPEKLYFNQPPSSQIPAWARHLDRPQFQRKDVPRFPTRCAGEINRSPVYPYQDPHLQRGKCGPAYPKGNSMQPIIEAQPPQVPPGLRPGKSASRLRRKPNFNDVEYPTRPVASCQRTSVA